MLRAPMDPPRTPTTRLRELRSSGQAGSIATRYLLGSGLTMCVYLGLGLLLSGPVGLHIQVAIPLAYGCALVVHFSIQRWFVWTHHGDYALQSHEQVMRYLALAGAQYAITALATATLPSVLGVSEQVVYVATALLAAAGSFLVLRYLVFHPG
jgi:putative flippase GtrA